MQVFLQKVIGIIVEFISNDSQLWQIYFRDFIILKWNLMHRKGQQRNLAEQLLYNYFDHLCNSNDDLQKLVTLHCHANVYYLSIAQMATTLRPLDVNHYLCVYVQLSIIYYNTYCTINREASPYLMI